MRCIGSLLRSGEIFSFSDQEVYPTEVSALARSSPVSASPEREYRDDRGQTDQGRYPRSNLRDLLGGADETEELLSSADRETDTPHHGVAEGRSEGEHENQNPEAAHPRLISGKGKKGGGRHQAGAGGYKGKGQAGKVTWADEVDGNGREHEGGAGRPCFRARLPQAAARRSKSAIGRQRDP